MTCRKCKWLKVWPNAAGKKIARRGNVYPCMFEPAMPVLPASITQRGGFRWPPDKGYVAPDDGAECPTFESNN
jgi:hypothetical protein